MKKKRVVWWLNLEREGEQEDEARVLGSQNLYVFLKTFCKKRISLRKTMLQ